MSKQTFVANTILTAAQMNTLQANDYNQTVATKTANYVLVASDAGTRVVMNVASANTVTVNTSLFTAGDTLVIQNIGAGVTTVTAGTATVSSAGPLAIPQNGSGILYFTSAGVSIFYPSAVTVAAPAAAGLTFIASGSASAVASLTISNCFSATYDNYKMIVANYFSSQAGYNFRLQYGTSTADTAADYLTGNIGVYSSTNAFINHAQPGGTGTGRKGGFTIEFQSPNLAQPTNSQSFHSSFTSTTTLGNFSLVSGQKPTTDQYTSLFLASEPPETFSFNYRIYGYANS